MPFAPAICSRCRHYGQRPKPQLFRPDDLQASAVLKSHLEWEQEAQQRSRLEQERLAAGQPFTYEPHSFPWCRLLTPRDMVFLSRLPELASDPAAARKAAAESQQLGERRLRDAARGQDQALQELAERGSAVMNPVTGDLDQVYVLCAQANAQGDCPLFEPKGG